MNDSLESLGLPVCACFVISIDHSLATVRGRIKKSQESLVDVIGEEYREGDSPS